MTNAYERIYRIWSEARERRLSVRIQFAIDQVGSCRVIRLGGREEWV